MYYFMVNVTEIPNFPISAFSQVVIAKNVNDAIGMVRAETPVSGKWEVFCLEGKRETQYLRLIQSL